jgi:hypothetical protein
MKQKLQELAKTSLPQIKEDILKRLEQQGKPVEEFKDEEYKDLLALC